MIARKNPIFDKDSLHWEKRRFSIVIITLDALRFKVVCISLLQS